MSIYCKPYRKIIYIAKLLNSDERLSGIWGWVLKSEPDQTCKMQVLPSEILILQICGSFFCLFVCLCCCFWLRRVFTEVRGLFVTIRGLSCSAACGLLVSWAGTEPVSPALEDGVLFSGPSRKSRWGFFLNKHYSWFWFGLSMAHILETFF